MNGLTCCRITEWQSDEWCKTNHAATQEKLQEIAGMISKNCKVKEIVDNGYGICTIYENDALNIRYWVKDRFGHISEIIEGRYH